MWSVSRLLAALQRAAPCSDCPPGHVTSGKAADEAALEHLPHRIEQAEGANVDGARDTGSFDLVVHVRVRAQRTSHAAPAHSSATAVNFFAAP